MGKSKRTLISQYSPSLPFKVAYSIIAAFIVLLHIVVIRLFVGADTAPFGMIPILLIFDAFVIWWITIFLTQTKVTLYEQGIELKRGGSRLFTPWKNVRRLGIKKRWRRQVSGLHLRGQAKPEVTGIIDGMFWGGKTDFLSIGNIIAIPMKFQRMQVKIDQETFLRTDFGKELYDLAPHAFDKDIQQKPKNQLRDDMHKDKESYWQEDSELSDEQRG